MQPARRGRRPLRVKATEAEPLLSFLSRNRLERKLLDIALAETSTPAHLREDAVQEIRTVWFKSQALPQFSFSETASYAHKIAKTAALRIRRELGAVVRLPGSAFQEDGRTYLTPGLLAAPLELEDAHDIEAPSPLSVISDIDPMQIQELFDKLTLDECAVLSELLAGNSVYKTMLNLGISRKLVDEHLAAIVQIALALGLGVATESGYQFSESDE